MAAAESLPSVVDPDEAIADRRARLQLVGDRVAPMALAGERTLPLLDELTCLFPEGLRRGSTVSLHGSGSTALALAVAAAASTAGSWVAVVGDPELGFAAAEEAGVALQRVLVVDPEPSSWSAAVAALVGAVDIVLIAPRHRVRDAEARRLSARLRERGSVLLCTNGRWPSGADVQLEIVESEWAGLGSGHGVLQARRVTIRGGGRGASARPRSADMLLPGPLGRPEFIVPDITVDEAPALAAQG